MELVEGMKEKVDAEVDRIRGDLKTAISGSHYTLEQVAAFAGISDRTLRYALSSEKASRIDTLVRAGLIVGVRFQLAEMPSVVARPKVLAAEAATPSAKPNRKPKPSTSRSRSWSPSTEEPTSLEDAKQPNRGRFQPKKAPARSERKKRGGASHRWYTHNGHQQGRWVAAQGGTYRKGAGSAHSVRPAGTCVRVLETSRKL